MTSLALADFADRWLRWIAAATWQLALLATIVAAVAALSRRASPRWRHALWLLVLVKAFLPPSLTGSWSVGAWGLAPLWRHADEAGITRIVDPAAGLVQDSEPAAAQTRTAAASADDARQSAPTALAITASQILLAVWAAGAVLFLGVAIARYVQLRRATRRMHRIDEGPARIMLERIALDFGELRVPDLYASETASSPFIFGVVRPVIVAPRQFLANRDAADVQTVLLHEMHHWRRRDPWIGWLQVLAQALFWFHPLVWLANARLRHEREAACDEAVLRSGACQPLDYGETLLRVLSAARARSLVQGNLVGVFERGGDLQARLEAVMNYQPRPHSFSVAARAALALFAVIFLPMAAPAAQPAAAKATAKATTKTVKTKPPRAKSGWFTSQPALGGSDVDPNLSEIVVKFDRPMSAGMSWTGGGEYFPETDEAHPAQWRDDKRTCVLPVKLKPGAFYRVGINASSFQNFQDENGNPAPHGVIYFATRGAKPAVERALRAPKIVETEPADGARDVDPSLKMLRINFNVPMGEGFSWTGDDSVFPAIPDGQRARWSRDRRTCLLPVALEPGRQYTVGVNASHAINFQSTFGVPVAPTSFSFTTSGDSGSTGGSSDKKSAAPKIVKMIPANHAKDVDPNLKVLRVTFDRPMAEGFSWTGGGPEFPTIPEGAMPRWSRDRKTCTLPVTLEAAKSYRLGLNSPSFKNFASRDGVPLDPIAYTFKTRND